MDLKQFEHLAPSGATHLFWNRAWRGDEVYAYFPDKKYEEAYNIRSKKSYPYGIDNMERLRKRETSVIYEIPPLNFENV